MSYLLRLFGLHRRTQTPFAPPSSVPSDERIDMLTPPTERYRLDLGVLLRTSELPVALRAPMRCGPHGQEGPLPEHFVAPASAASIASLLLRALLHGHPAPNASQIALLPPAPLDVSVDQACANIAELAACVHQLGALPPFAGSARPMWLSGPQHMRRERLGSDTEWPWLPGGDADRTLRLAWCVCAISYLRPPRIDWTREPSLAWWRGDEVIELVWPASV